MGQKRGRTQRKHFRQSRENVWKYSNNNNSKNNKETSSDDPLSGETNDDNAIANANPNPNPPWQPFATKNPNFDDYYKEQAIVPLEEWDAFVASLRTPLPAAFRINASGQFFQDIKLQVENDFVKSLEAEITNGSEVEAIRPLPWYPGSLAWHLNFSRMQLRKNQMLERFHEFLKQENEIGNITRQEAVSMVPPLFLNVLPEHYVLDMCAAPGSKTFQLLEIMHQSADAGTLPTGLVIANDVDVQRCNLLIHQTKRMCSANLIVTNHEAQHFPSCHVRSGFSVPMWKDGAVLTGSTCSTQGLEAQSSSVLFDRVLCDVPCSGDGTLRKAPDIWRKWHSGMGNGLHVLQVHIAMRGLSLLKVGGRMVYSTCSMNPVENEAVVSEILHRCGASVELLDVSEELPELVRRPGLRKWKVRDKGLWLSSFHDVPANRKSTILPSMFPSGQKWSSGGISSSIKCIEDTSIDDNTANYDIKDTDKEIISDHPLERCIRILPHDQNSGAFFIAVFQKVSSLPVIPEKCLTVNKHHINRKYRVDNSSRALDNENNTQRDDSSDIVCSDPIKVNKKEPTEDGEGILSGHECIEGTEDGETSIGDVNIPEVGDAKGRPQMQGKWKGIDPVVFFNDEKAIQSIKDFYGISPSFPLIGHLVSRNEDVNRVKRIYYISKAVHDILDINFKIGQRLKIASLGLKMFERQTSKDDSSPCAFRISSEGLPLLLPHITMQILYASLIDFQHLLKYRNIKFSEFCDGEFGEKASNLILGCCVVVLKEGNEPTDTPLTSKSAISIVCWRGRTSLSVMVSEMDGRELLERISFRFKINNSPNSENDESMQEVETDVKVHPAKADATNQQQETGFMEAERK